MGKETQLLEAAAAGNHSKVEQILKGRSGLKRLLSKERILGVIDENETDGEPSLLIQVKLKSSYVDVNCRDENGCTPLVLAALNGHRAVVYTLLQYSASVHGFDKQGNTALHFAAWQNRSEIAELLLVNGAKADITNEAGNTPLHYSCQYCPPRKTLTIIKLLQHDCGTMMCNKAGDNPFDLAVRFNRKEAVSLLVDAEPNLLKHTKAIIEAAKSGRTDIVESLLDAGVDANCFDGASGSCPLHEAVRFFRKDVARVLLEFGAQPNQRSANDESAVDIAMHHPGSKRDDFLTLFQEYAGKTPRIPRSLLEQSRQGTRKESEELFITYPLLRNKPNWTKIEPDFCSAWTQKHPHTCLLDNDPTSYWKIPAAGAYNWVAFDLGGDFILTGIRLSGWNHKQMVHSFILETGKSLTGPWQKVGKYTADMVGSEDMEEAAETQDFRGFYATARYWKLTIADNFGDHTTCLSEVQFFGIEAGVLEWFDRLDMKHHLKGLVQRGFNQLSDLSLLTERDIQEMVNVAEEKRRLFHGIRLLREKYYPPTNLQWAAQPPTKVTSDKLLPELAVFSEPFTIGDLQLVVHGGAELKGSTVVPLVAKDNGYLSKTSFRGISLSPAGKYIFEVRSVTDPAVTLRAPEPITVVPPPMRNSEIGRVFQDFEDMLQFDI